MSLVYYFLLIIQVSMYQFASDEGTSPVSNPQLPDTSTPGFQESVLDNNTLVLNVFSSRYVCQSIFSLSIV